MMHSDILVADPSFDSSLPTNAFCTSLMPAQTFVTCGDRLFLLEKQSHANSPFMSIMMSNDTVIPSSSITVLTLFDPAFLLCAYFASDSMMQQHNVFEPLESHPALLELVSLFPKLKDVLSKVCATKEYGGMTVFRLDDEKMKMYFKTKWEISDKSTLVRDLVAVRLSGKYLESWLTIADNATRLEIPTVRNKNDVTIIGDVLETRQGTADGKVGPKAKGGAKKKDAPPPGTKAISSFFKKS